MIYDLSQSQIFTFLALLQVIILMNDDLSIRKKLVEWISNCKPFLSISCEMQGIRLNWPQKVIFWQIKNGPLKLAARQKTTARFAMQKTPILHWMNWNIPI